MLGVMATRRSGFGAPKCDSDWSRIRGNLLVGDATCIRFDALSSKHAFHADDAATSPTKCERALRHALPKRVQRRRVHCEI